MSTRGGILGTPSSGKQGHKPHISINSKVYGVSHGRESHFSGKGHFQEQLPVSVPHTVFPVHDEGSPIETCSFLNANQRIDQIPRLPASGGICFNLDGAPPCIGACSHVANMSESETYEG